MSQYQIFKLQLVSGAGISKDGFHIILGFLIFLVFASVFTTKMSSWKTLIAPVTLALILETLDFKDAIIFNEPINYIDSLKDIFITIISPVVLVAYFRIRNYDI